MEGDDSATTLQTTPADSLRPRLAKAPNPTTRKDRSTRSSKQGPSTSKPKSSSLSQAKASSSSQPKTSSTSQPKAPSSDTNLVGSNPTRGSPRRSGGIASGDTVSSLPVSLSTQLTFTSPALDFRPTSIKPKPQLHPHNAPRWLVPADKMLVEVPTGWIWHTKIVQVDRSLLAAVATDTIAVPDDAVGAVNDTQNEDRLLKLVRGFAHRHSVQRINFQHFLLVCLCRVLSAQGFPRSSIVETLQICISDTSEANMDGYLKGAKWANNLLNRLFFTDWGYRAIDLMVLCTCGGKCS